MAEIDSFCGLDAILAKMPLIQLHHEQRSRLGNNSHWSIKAALEAGTGGAGRLTEGMHMPAQSLTPTET